MPRPYRQHTAVERRTISRSLDAELQVEEIAEQLDRPRSAITLEIQRNHFSDQRPESWALEPHRHQLSSSGLRRRRFGRKPRGLKVPQPRTITQQPAGVGRGQ